MIKVIWATLISLTFICFVFFQISISRVKFVPPPVPDSEPGSVGDLCTKDRVPKKVHLSPPLPSFPPMSVLGLGLLSSGVVRKGVELSCNQLLHFPTAKQQVNWGHLPFERLLKKKNRNGKQKPALQDVKLTCGSALVKSGDWHRVWHWGWQRGWLKGFHSGWIVLMLWACPPWSPHLAFSTSAEGRQEKHEQAKTQATHRFSYWSLLLADFLNILHGCSRTAVNRTVTAHLMNLHSIGRMLRESETYDTTTSQASV